MSVMRPDLIMKAVVPVVMAGIVAIYGLVISVLIANECKPKHYHMPPLQEVIIGFLHSQVKVVPS